MIRPPRSDFWQVGVVRAPLRSFLEPAKLALQPPDIAWLPDPGPWRYLADPFGLQRGGLTHVFVEAFDYRTRHAVIERHELGPSLEWRGKSVALQRPFHLSYPFIVEEDGEVFMIPESFRAGEVALYRARQFPDKWERETVLLADIPAAEPSLLRRGNRWWMFFTLVGKNHRDQRELHVAFADKLTGPWTLHPRNPILDDRSGARPGGTPFFSKEGDIILPVQDCSRTYGGAAGFVQFKVLTTTDVALAPLAPRVTGGLFSATHRDGCHTLSACGNLTLVDTKRIVHSWARHGINLQRRWRRMMPAAVAAML